MVGKNASWEILQDNINDINQLNDLQIYWIAKLNTLSPNGYNLNKGGKNRLLSEETKLKISQKQKGKIRSVETRLQTSKTLKERYKHQFCHWKNKKKDDDLIERTNAPKRIYWYYIWNVNNEFFKTDNLKAFCIEHCLIKSIMAGAIRKNTIYKNFAGFKLLKEGKRHASGNSGDHFQ